MVAPEVADPLFEDVVGVEHVRREGTQFLLLAGECLFSLFDGIAGPFVLFAVGDLVLAAAVVNDAADLTVGWCGRLHTRIAARVTLLIGDS